jgi:predicted solute-binding protein
LDPSSAKLRVCAVSYLNTVPLVWGMLHGAQRGLFDLLFRVPADCADMVAAGAADIGIIPCVELAGRDYGTVPGVGIACRGPVRSVLLVCRTGPREIRTLAADVSSRTSVALARIILSRRYGVEPQLAPHAPDVRAMLEQADAAVIIGDPALRLDPASLPFQVHDLGQEWMELTGLPMVFAVWAGPHRRLTAPVVQAFQDSCRFGLERIHEIAAAESQPRGFSAELVRDYLTSNTVFELGPAETRGMELYLRYAAALPGHAPVRSGQLP